MADIADRANDQMEYLLEVALKRCQRPTTHGASLQFCEDCDEPIPELRRETIQGCETCVSCQGLRERRR